MPFIKKAKKKYWEPEKKKNIRRRKWEPERKPQEGRLVKTTFYKSTPWRKAREQYIIENPICEECLRAGKAKPAKIVDHIEQINRENPYDLQGGRYPDPLDPSNFQSLCIHHHAVKSGRERHKKNDYK